MIFLQVLQLLSQHCRLPLPELANIMRNLVELLTFVVNMHTPK